MRISGKFETRISIQGLPDIVWNVKVLLKQFCAPGELLFGIKTVIDFGAENAKS